MDNTLPVALIVIASLLFIILNLNLRLVKEHTVGIIERMGRFDRIASPGIHFLVPFVDRMVMTVPTDIQKRVVGGTVIRYRIIDPEAYYTIDDNVITDTLIWMSSCSSDHLDDQDTETHGLKIISVSDDN